MRVYESFLLTFCFLAILVTGGHTGNITLSKSVEVLKEDGTHLCWLPDMYDVRTDHTQSGFLACGSSTETSDVWINNRQSCITMHFSGVWMQSHGLMKNRSGHTSWTFKNVIAPHVILMGGDGGDDNTTELLNVNFYFSQNHFQLNQFQLM